VGHLEQNCTVELHLHCWLEGHQNMAHYLEGHTYSLEVHLVDQTCDFQKLEDHLDKSL